MSTVSLTMTDGAIRHSGQDLDYLEESSLETNGSTETTVLIAIEIVQYLHFLLYLCAPIIFR